MYRQIKFFCLTIVIFISTNLCANQSIFTIALVGPFSGPYAGYGMQVFSGASQAVKDLNEHGGIKGFQLEILPVDDQCNIKQAQIKAEQLVKQSIGAVIGPTCSAVSANTLDIYAKANILTITPAATSTKITQKGIMTLFRMIGRDDQQAHVAADFIVKKLKSQRVAILHTQDSYSKDAADYVSEYMVTMGHSPVLYQDVPLGTTNFKPLIKKFKELEVDAIYFSSYYPEVGALAKTLHVFQMQIPLISGDGIVLNEFVNSAGGVKSAGNVMMTFPVDPKTLDTTKPVIKAMEAAKLETHGHALYAYAAVEAIAAAMEHSNEHDGKTLAQWLHHHEVNTILGPKAWDTNGDVIDSEFKVYIWGSKDNYIEVR